MNFENVKIGSKLYIRIAFTMYNVLFSNATVVELTEGEIVANWGLNANDTIQLSFDRHTGIGIKAPGKYAGLTFWIQHYDFDYTDKHRIVS